MIVWGRIECELVTRLDGSSWPFRFPADEERPLVHACATICSYEAGQVQKGGKD